MRQKGFTLIEILIALIVIGALACLAMVKLNGAKVNAQCAETLVIAHRIEQELSILMLKHGWDQDGWGYGENLQIHMENFLGQFNGGPYFNYSYGKVPAIGDIPAYFEIYVLARTDPNNPYHDDLWCKQMFEDGEARYMIDENHPWHKYVKTILPPNTEVVDGW